MGVTNFPFRAAVYIIMVKSYHGKTQTFDNGTSTDVTVSITCHKGGDLGQIRNLIFLPNTLSISFLVQFIKKVKSIYNFLKAKQYPYQIVFKEGERVSGLSAFKSPKTRYYCDHSYITIKQGHNIVSACMQKSQKIVIF